MGIYDRPYYRDDVQASLAPSWNQRSAIANIIIVNVVVFVADALFGGRENHVVKLFELNPLDWHQPWMLWRTLTYGFVHDPESPWHLFWNMLGLWMLGRAVEERYRRTEFLRIYLICLVVCGFGWLIRQNLTGGSVPLIGASGAVSCIVMLFVLNWPKTTIMIWGILPIPAWVLGVLLILGNIGNDAGRMGGGGIAYDVHLIGIAFAAAYFLLKWNFSSLDNITSKLRIVRRRMTGPRLKVHKAETVRTTSNDDLEADRILQKIHETGQDSLSGTERRFMEKYSRRVRKRRDDLA